MDFPKSFFGGKGPKFISLTLNFGEPFKLGGSLGGKGNHLFLRAFQGTIIRPKGCFKGIGWPNLGQF